MKFISQLILFGILAYFLVSAIGFWWLMFGAIILFLANISK